MARRKYQRRVLPRPTSLEEVEDHLIYNVDSARSLFGASDRQVRRWVDAGDLKKLDNTGTHVRFSGAQLREFAGRVLGAKSPDPTATRPEVREEAA